MAAVSGSPGQFCGPRSELQAPHETSPIVLQRFFSPVADPQEKLIFLTDEIKDLCLAWAAPVRLLQGKPFSPPPHRLVVTTDASSLGWGAVLSPHSVSGVWTREEALDHVNFLELRAVFLALKSFEEIVKGQSLLIRSDNTTVVAYINHQGGTHSPPPPLSVDVEPVEVVSSETHSPSRFAYSGGGKSVSRFPFEGEVSPVGMDLESSDLSQDLSGVECSSGNRLICVSPQLSTSQVLCSESRPRSVEDRCDVLPVGRPTAVRLPSLLFPSQGTGEDCSGRSGGSSHSSLLASETVVPVTTVSSGGFSQGIALSERHSHATHVSADTSQCSKSSSFTLATFRQQGKKAGLS